MILTLETATSNCSVALHSTDGETIAVMEKNELNIHASQLFIFIESILRDNNAGYHDLKAIAVSKGPGSYTGLRIGVSAAKGLCYSLDLPLISINTLQSMAYGIVSKIEMKDAMLIPMIDARRMEVYNSVYDLQLNEINPTRALIVDENSFNDYRNRTCYFFGDGMLKCKPLFSNQKNWFFIDAVYPSASHAGFMAGKKYKEKNFENTAYFEPYYLKEFVSQSTFHQK